MASLARLIIRVQAKAIRRQLIILGIPVHRADRPLDRCAHPGPRRLFEYFLGCYQCSDRYTGKHAAGRAA